MSVVLAEVTRGDIVESRHRGYVVAADGAGNVIASAGDYGTRTYMRSSAKPIQALSVVMSGAADQFELSGEELAIMCASHYGEDIHRLVIFRILDKLGLPLNGLLCGTPLSIDSATMKRQLRERLPQDEANSDCSGKHCGFLAVCKASGYPTEGYNTPEHPLQADIIKNMSYMCGIDAAQIGIGVDGCGVPVHSLPLVNMAVGYARLATPTGLDESYRIACNRVFAAMNAAPEMVAGTNGFCTELLKHTSGRLCAKIGAEAVYCIGVKDKNLGIAIKIEDGSMRAVSAIVMRTLTQLKLLNALEQKALEHFAAPDIINDLGDTVGAIKSGFELTFS